MRKAVSALCLSILALSIPLAARAQAVYGSIVGTVVDSSGAGVPNAKVTITDLNRSVSFTTTTNESGFFTQRSLIGGRYQVRIEATGFSAYVQEVSVSVDQETTVDIKLQVGQLSETVEVTGGAPLLKTERSDVATTFSEKTVASLPILNRRFTAFELLTPGVQATTSQTASSEDPQGSYRKVVNGQSFAGSSHLLDGTDNHDALLGLIVINPTLESLTEAKITTANYDAEFGATAGVISAQTKSGTNDLRGALSYFLRDDVFMARNPFTQFQTIPGTDRYIPVTQWNQFGGALGGPIAKNNLFFFGDYQGTRTEHRRIGAAARALGSGTPGRSQRAGCGHLRPGERRDARGARAIPGQPYPGVAPVASGPEPARS